jgi:hypothetical protein
MRETASDGKGKAKVERLFSDCHDVRLMVYEVQWTFRLSRNTKGLNPYKNQPTFIDKNENKEISFFGIFHSEKSLQSYLGAIAMAISKKLKGSNIPCDAYDLSW